jgi:hypothetical protein
MTGAYGGDDGGEHGRWGECSCRVVDENDPDPRHQPIRAVQREPHGLDPANPASDHGHDRAERCQRGTGPVQVGHRGGHHDGINAFRRQHAADRVPQQRLTSDRDERLGDVHTKPLAPTGSRDERDDAHRGGDGKRLRMR